MNSTNGTYEEIGEDTATIWLPLYDPDFPVDRTNQIAQLASICVINSLTLIIIVARTWYRGTKLKRYRADDKWIIAAGVLLAFPLFVCQIGTNVYGSGLHALAIRPEWQKPHWIFSWGWSAAYMVSAMIRVSVCMCLLDIVPHAFQTVRRCIYGLCVLLLSLGLSLTCVWLFQYRPFLANFDYNVDATYWIDLDKPRYLWAAMNLPIDLAIIGIPYVLIRKTKLKAHERRIIFMVFGAQALGTIASVIGIYGVWLNRAEEVQDIYWNESIWLILTDIEIFAYTLGATFPMFSRYFIQKAAPRESQQQAGQLSWFRVIGNTISAHTSPQPRIHSPHNSRIYDEIHNGKTPPNKSTEKLETVPLYNLQVVGPNLDLENSKLEWVTTKVTINEESDDRGEYGKSNQFR